MTGPKSGETSRKSGRMIAEFVPRPNPIIGIRFAAGIRQCDSSIQRAEFAAEVGAIRCVTAASSIATMAT